MAPSTNNIGTKIFTPAETFETTVEHIDFLKTTKTVSFPLPVPEIGMYFPPVRPGQIVGVLGQSGHYKSGFLHFIEREGAALLQKQGREDEIIVHISTEEDIEEQGVFELAASSSEDNVATISRGEIRDKEQLLTRATQLSGVPIWRIGVGLERGSLFRDMYLSNVFKSVEYLRDELDLRIAAVFIDYLQALPFDPEVGRMRDKINQRRLQVRNDIYTIRESSKTLATPIWVAMQAKTQLVDALSQDIQIPGLYDVHESSDVSHRVDRMISLWLPKQKHVLGKELQLGGIPLIVEDNTLLIRVTKQRGGLPSGKLWVCEVDYERNRVKIGDVGF